MFKDLLIAVLAGIAIVQQYTLPGDPKRPVLVMGATVLILIIILGIDDLWDKRQRIKRHINSIAAAISASVRSSLRSIRSWGRWQLIQLRVWPVEAVQRRRRRRVIRECMRQIQNIQPREGGRNPEERRDH